jgi:hypothetical protein
MLKLKLNPTMSDQMQLLGAPMLVTSKCECQGARVTSLYENIILFVDVGPRPIARKIEIPRIN